VYQDRSNPSGDSDSKCATTCSTLSSKVLAEKDNCSTDLSCSTSTKVVVSLPTKSSKSSASTSSNNPSEKKVRQNKKSNKKKSVSKRQKLLRKRFESQKLEYLTSTIEEDDEDNQDVKMKYSIVYFNWTVSDSEEESDDDDDECNEFEFIQNVVLPLKQMTLKK